MIAITDQLVMCSNNILKVDLFVPYIETRYLLFTVDMNQYSMFVGTDRTFIFPDTGWIKKILPGLFTDLINLANLVDWKNLVTGSVGEYI
jgi:hypothetical protein